MPFSTVGGNAVLSLEQIKFLRGEFSLTANWSIEAGARVAVVGPSGGGKSTLLSLISGFDVPASGAVKWKDKNLGGVLPGERPIAMIFQYNYLFPHLDIETNVALGRDPAARPSAGARDEARTALASVGLEGMGTRYPSELSGGQQGRAALARVLLTHKPLVLLDEPFAALGPALRVEMLDLVNTILPDATIIMVSHDPNDAKHWATHVVFVDDGIASPPLPTAEFFQNPSPAVQNYLA